MVGEGLCSSHAKHSNELNAMPMHNVTDTRAGIPGRTMGGGPDRL